MPPGWINGLRWPKSGMYQTKDRSSTVSGKQLRSPKFLPTQTSRSSHGSSCSWLGIGMSPEHVAVLWPCMAIPVLVGVYKETPQRLLGKVTTNEIHWLGGPPITSPDVHVDIHFLRSPESLGAGPELFSKRNKSTSAATCFNQRSVSKGPRTS